MNSPILLSLLIIIGNSPQLWLSFGYLLWNNQLTRIWMVHEWRTYYQKRHLSCVSYDTDDKGTRTSRWLQLPYWLTGTLMMVSTLLHFLVSEALFVVEIFNESKIHLYYLNHSPLAISVIGAK